jgi:predicted acyltransferase
MSNPAESPRDGTRLISLDALRGFDMLMIIGADEIVSGLGHTGDGPLVSLLVRQFTHKPWEGFSFYDLIFPLFVFVSGVSLVFSLDRAVERHGIRGAIVRLSRRALLLFFLGVLYSGGMSQGFEKIRWMGVLQRIALSYFAAAIIYLACGKRWKGILGAIVVILVAYWALLSFVAAPGESAVSFAEGHNLANWVDTHYLPGRKYDGAWDPEGLLSSVPAVATCLLGVLAAFVLRHPLWSQPRKVLWLVGIGVALTALGFAWGLQFPVIKKLWTSSYVLVAGGYSLLLLGLFYLVVDVWKFRRGIAPLVWVGSNALTLYLAARFIQFPKLARMFVGGEIMQSVAPWGEVLAGVVSLCLVVGLAGFLYRQRLFLRV